ncbi:MAG: hypothetical protein CL916_10890 [Deltaproteobacteria bacterium]|nr:hypothetical protein [Deltaproteobacteria bacterium]
MFLWIFSCISSHHILTLADGGSAEQKQKNAQELVQIIENTESVRHYYFVAETAGKLKVPNTDLEEKLSFMLLSRSNRPEIRAKAAWALGEIGRTEGRVYKTLLSSLSSESNPMVLQSILEAIAKVYLSRSHNTQEDLTLVRRLDELHSRTGYQSPFFTYLHRSVESMEVLSILLLEAIEQKKHIENPDEYYRIVLNFLWFCTEHQIPLVNRFSENKETLSQVFSKILQDAKKQDPSVIFLSLWFLVLLSEDPNMADLTGTSIINMDDEDGTYSTLKTIFLSNLLTNTTVRDYFRNIGFQHIEDERLLTFLANHHDRRDIIQYLYGIAGK